MISITQHGPVTAIRMARSLFGRPLYWTAAYWVDGLLIDSGPPCTVAQLVRLLDDIGVNQVVVTHSHEDHIGGLAQIQQRFPHAAIYAPRGALPRIADPSLLKMPLFRRAFWGNPQPVHNVRSLDEVEDMLVTSAYKFRIVETPGHSPAHISVVEPTQGWIFCGDAFIGGQDRAWMQEYDLFGVVSSMRTLASLQPQWLFPGSGTVRSNPVPEIQAKIDAYIRLAQQVAQRTTQGATVAEMASELLGGETRMRLWTGGHFSAENLIKACQSYNELVSHDNAEGNMTIGARQGTMTRTASVYERHDRPL